MLYTGKQVIYYRAQSSVFPTCTHSNLPLELLKLENVRFVPITNFQPYFDVVPNSRFFFQIRGLCEELRHYTPETKTGYFMISIRDSTLSRSCLPDSDTGIDLLSYSAGNKRIADSENKIQTVPFAI